MDYQILVEKQPHNGFVATALGWPDCVAVGTTKEEAVVQVRSAVAGRLAHGEIVHVRIETSEVTQTVIDPWESMIGRFADDPYWDDFQDELKRIREEANRIEIL